MVSDADFEEAQNHGSVTADNVNVSQPKNDGNVVPLSTIFSRLRDLGLGSPPPKSVCMSGPHVTLSSVAEETSPSEQMSPPINHAFLCMDIGGRSISPRIIDFVPGKSTSCASKTVHSSVSAVNCSLPFTEDGSPGALHPTIRSKSRSSSQLSSRVQNVNRPLPTANQGVSSSYIDLGDCNQECVHCGCLFWYGERLKGYRDRQRPEYHLCCGGGQIYMPPAHDPPVFIKQLLTNKRFMEHIRAYNQMFAMTSFGAKIDHSVNRGRGPYVFKLSGQIYHWIGSLCPEEGNHPRFLQLYFYDTHDEINNRMRHFQRDDDAGLSQDIVEGLVRVLDEHNGLVCLFRTARDRCTAGEIPKFKVRLYSKGGVHGYELPTSDVLGGIVFKEGPNSRTDFDVIIEARGGNPKRINKLHQSYMSLQFLLLFVFGEPGFYPELMLKPRNNKGRSKKVSMNAYYRYQLHPRVKEFGLIFRGGRLFQQYVVAVFCAIEQARLDWIRKKQDDLRSDYLMGLYDAVTRGDRQGIHAGSMILLPKTFTGGPRYMYSHYLDALAICRSLGNPQYFVTFTCNVNWPEIKRYMALYPGLTPTDKADVVCRVFHQKVNDFI